MSDITEGLGAAVQGALAGRAVEPDRGENGAEEAEQHVCSNCGALTHGAYCHQCGQKQHIHRTLTALAHDLIHGVLHLDGKLSKTLPLLVFKPGALTRRYIEGERAKFVSPMAMFLFSVFLMFAVFQMVGLTTPTTLGDSGVVQGAFEGARDAANDRREQLRSEIEALSADASESERSALQDELAQLEADLERAEGVSSEVINQIVEEDGGVELDTTGVGWLDAGIKKWRENPGLMLYKLQANAYKFSWLLIPLSVPFVWLTFAWRRRFKAYDHAIFVTYSLSFMSLLFITASLLTLSPGLAPIAGLLVALVPPIHLYKQLRKAYDLSRFSALWRLIVISAFIWIVIALFLQALLFLGVF